MDYAGRMPTIRGGRASISSGITCWMLQGCSLMRQIVNAALYAYEKEWANAAICAASAIPAVGAAIIGVAKSAKAVIKAKQAEKIASLAAEASRMTKNSANTLDAFSDTMKAVSKWGDNPLKLVDGVTTETASKALKARETGGAFAKESQKAVWEMKAVVGADGIR